MVSTGLCSHLGCFATNSSNLYVSRFAIDVGSLLGGAPARGMVTGILVAILVGSIGGTPVGVVVESVSDDTLVLAHQ